MARAPADASARSSAHRDSLGLRARYVAVRLRQFERAVRIEHALSVAGALVDRAEGRVRAHRMAVADLDAARAAFSQSLGRAYREPEVARAAFATAVAREGTEHAIQQLRDRPEVFGSLLSQERAPRMLGGLGTRRSPDPTAARHADLVAADRARRMDAAARAVPPEAERQRALAALETARARYDSLRTAADELPLRHRLAGNLAHAAEGLSAREWARLRPSLTARQALIGDVFRDAVRVDRALAQRQLSRAARSAAHGSPTSRQHRARVLGAAVHRAISRVAPRELRQVTWAIGAIGHPGLAVKRVLTQRVREAMLGPRQQER